MYILRYVKKKLPSYKVSQQETKEDFNNISAVIDTVHYLMFKWVQANNNERSKIKKNINKSIEDLLK